MKKSTIYRVAMCCVIEDRRLETKDKLEVIERLMDDMRLAEFCEKKDEEDKF